MCGLVFTTLSSVATSAQWKRCVDVIECRGPDDIRQVSTDQYTAGHSRLAIIGLGAAGQQPYSHDPDADVLLFNGEIYNYREIGSDLGVEAESDTQVLYHLLRRGRTEKLSELRGMFAFVFWKRDPQIVIAARDFFGIKPLYVAEGLDGSLSFASVPAALAPLLARQAADPEAVAGFLATGFFPSATSAFDGIEKCPEGIVTTWKRTGSGWQRTTDALGIDSWPTLPTGEAIDDSVRAHLVSDVPVGVLLSGGIDSTLIAACAAEQIDGLLTFSLTNPDNPSIDEASYARWNATIIGTRHTEVPFESAGSLDIIRELVRSTGEPFGDAAYIPLSVLCERVAGELKVVLAGEGADELFGGYRRYEVERHRYAGLTGPPLRALSRVRKSHAAYLDREPSQPVRAWAQWGETDDYLAHAFLLSSEWSAVAAALPTATPAALARQQRTWSSLPELPQSLSLPSHKAYDLTQWLPNVFLEKSDRASMLNSVEVRVPYLDPVVARASMAVRPDGTTKAALRSALLAKLPDVRLPPRKMGLSVDVATLISSTGLDEYVTFMLHDSGSIIRTMDSATSDLLERRAALNPTLAFRL
ncbi:MAG: asparagine synthase (glutamine-hydrolyzing), partial [bacterium]|nr:asparagine synthase (glutamine-hydrolyzing) [bacterium]